MAEGALVFAKACELGPEGTVSKRAGFERQRGLEEGGGPFARRLLRPIIRISTTII
jgi:hypothetical protein